MQAVLRIYIFSLCILKVLNFSLSTPNVGLVCDESKFEERETRSPLPLEKLKKIFRTGEVRILAERHSLNT